MRIDNNDQGLTLMITHIILCSEYFFSEAKSEFITDWLDDICSLRCPTVVEAHLILCIGLNFSQNLIPVGSAGATESPQSRHGVSPGLLEMFDSQ